MKTKKKNLPDILFVSYSNVVVIRVKGKMIWNTRVTVHKDLIIQLVETCTYKQHTHTHMHAHTHTHTHTKKQKQKFQSLFITNGQFRRVGC